MAVSVFRQLALAGVASVLIASVGHAQQSTAESEEKEEKIEQVVEDAVADTDSEESQVGEASYNIEDCRALIEKEDQQDGDASSEESGEGVEALDLDKCRTLVK